jgi:alginate O-acetyltransferase complex protein AlgI
MLFPTVLFAVFFVAVFIANWILRPRYWLWRSAMIIASFYFYFRSPNGSRLIWLLVGSIVFNYLAARATAQLLGPDRAKTPGSIWAVRGAVAANVAMLGYFKYYEFFRTDVLELANRFPGLALDPPALEIILPVGVSFFTFQALSYVIDVGRGRIRAMTLGDFSLYLSFFPQLVAGPIVRATEFVPQMHRRPDPRRVNSAEAFRLILFGLFKKVVISSFLATHIVDDVFRAPSEFSALENLVAIYAYAIQIYADFSGYTDIAIGCALLLGFRFPQNFDAPYRSLSIQEFWRRWHMTLSRWLRDYLYIPLGGNRKGVERTYVNLILTMVLGGLWHGAAWTFVIWGLIHGVALAAERLIKKRWTPIGLPSPLVRVMQWFLTFQLVCLAWVFFRAQDLDQAFEMLGQLVGGLGEMSPLVTPLLLAVIGLAILSQFVPESFVIRVQDQVSRVHFVWQGIGLAVGITIIDTLGPEGVAPFIYFQF